MHCIKINKVIAQMICLFYLMGFWHRSDKPTARELRFKLFYCIYYSLFILSFMVGAIRSEKMDSTIFLTEVSVTALVYGAKLGILIWKQKQIIDLLNRVCQFSIRDDYGYVLFKDKLKGFITFLICFEIAVAVGAVLSVLVLPFFGSEKTLFFEIAFPLDWRNNDVAFCVVTVFIFIGIMVTIFVLLFTILIWYLLLNCSLRYEILGQELKNMGQIAADDISKISEKQLHNNFFQSLKESINTHVHLRGLTNDLGSFYSEIFLTQLGTSGLCICGSIYCLAFSIGDNLLEHFVHLLVFLYFIADIFMITYFGNEIMLSSNRLSYNLFESNWYNQPQSTKMCIIIFGEHLKQPQAIVIGKLYPLTLETFTKILNSAYSMFNILKNIKR
ncbi:odorant receptor 94a-like [Bradysia coprophila]|uniref:odorant receptor 94a-like n=1 Tax=Bradysia coprophila TaxID=38358 RepID=UPI00187D949A|nr:odorant receptor 94a-like [Bradysia coprophila]